MKPPYESTISAIVQKNQIDHYGIAELSSAAPFLEKNGVLSSTYPYAISVGINLFHDIVDQLPNRAHRAVSVAYRHHCYDIINNRLDLFISEASSMLQKAGHRVLPIPASKRIDDDKLCGAFSHKLAANLCGHGWIGKSCLLITPSIGPRVRFATILTDAPLQPTGTSLPNQCGDCEECVKICPAEAFTGRSFQESEDRDARYDASQ